MVLANQMSLSTKVIFEKIEVKKKTSPVYGENITLFQGISFLRHWPFRASFCLCVISPVEKVIHILVPHKVIIVEAFDSVKKRTLKHS